MKLFNRSGKVTFTQFFTWLANIFALYYCIIEFVSGSLSWIFSGSSILITNSALIVGYSEFIQITSQLTTSKIFHNYLIKVVIIYYLYSSTYGLILAIINLPISDKSYLFIPFIILFLGFAGSILNIYNTLRKK